MGDVIDYKSTPRIAGQPLKRLRVGFADPGDVILSHKGTVGRVAICDIACVLSPQTTYYRPSPSAFTSEFLRFQLLSPFFQRQLDEVKSQTTRDFVPISEQYKLFLLRPSLTEQREIASRLRIALAWIDRLAAEATSARKLIDHLDQAILAKAFRGELVPQDPNDEPASVLLERIRAARLETSAPPRQQKAPRPRKRAVSRR
jgi:type I restriction enzyme S subunit